MREYYIFEDQNKVFYDQSVEEEDRDAQGESVEVRQVALRYLDYCKDNNKFLKI